MCRQTAAREDQHRFVRLGFVRLLFDPARFLSTQEPFGEPGVDRLAALPVVVVLRVHLDMVQPVQRIEMGVDGADGGIFDRGRIRRPVAGRRDQQERTRRHQGPDFEVARFQAQIRGVLAQTAALHGGGDHVDRGGDLYARIDRRQDEGLGAPARRAGAADALRVDIGQALQEIDGADAVAELERHGAQAPEAFPRAAVAVLDLPGAVVVTDHIVGEDDVTLPGEVYAAGWNGADLVILQAPPLPMAVGTDDPGERTGFPSGAVEIPRGEEARKGLEMDLFNAVAFALDSGEDLGVEGRRLMLGQQTGGDPDLQAQRRRLLGPLGMGVAGKGVRGSHPP